MARSLNLFKRTLLYGAAFLALASPVKALETKISGTITNGSNPVPNMIVQAINDQGILGSDTTGLFGKFNIKLSDDPVGIDDNESLPSQYFLGQNYPNPANPSTRINAYLPRNENAFLTIYNILGQQIKKISLYRGQGNYEIEFNFGNLASGVYIYELRSKSFRQAKKLTILDGGSGLLDLRVVSHSDNMQRRNSIGKQAGNKALISIKPLPGSIQEEMYSELEKTVDYNSGQIITFNEDLSSRFSGKTITGRASLITKNKIGDNSLPETDSLLAYLSTNNRGNYGIVDNQGKFVIELPNSFSLQDSAFLLLGDGFIRWSNFFDKIKPSHYDFNKEPFVLEVLKEEIPKDGIFDSNGNPIYTVWINSFDILKILTGTDPKRKPYLNPYISRMPTLQEILELGIKADTTYQVQPYKVFRASESDPLIKGAPNLLPDSIAAFVKEATDELSRDVGIPILEGHVNPLSGLPQRNIAVFYKSMTNAGETKFIDGTSYNGSGLVGLAQISINNNLTFEEWVKGTTKHEMGHVLFGTGIHLDYLFTLMASGGQIQYFTKSENTAIIQEHKIPIWRDMTKVNSDSTLVECYKNLINREPITTLNKSSLVNALKDYYQEFEQAKKENYVPHDSLMKYSTN